MHELATGGVDIGSSAVKVALVASGAGSGRARPGARLLAVAAERLRRRDPLQVAEGAWRAALEEAGLAAGDVVYLATTGEGERFAAATGHFYGMTAHARGALFLDAEARAVLDAGALHARAIRFDEHARVLEYRMTSQCASGSGQFLENVSRYLGVSVDEIGGLSRRARAPQKVSSVCAVLAETDVINLVSRGAGVPDVLAGIHQSMAGRFVKLLRSAGAEGVLLLTGGLGQDEGLFAALEEAIGGSKVRIAVRTHALGTYAGAIGAALWGAYRHERMTAPGVSSAA
jgi:benzoyl-CoA reductase subunit D